MEKHPFDEEGSPSKASPCILVIFGVTGDLTKRKILPALYHLTKEGLLPSNFACVGFARREKTTEEFRAEIKDLLLENKADKALIENFINRFFYHRSPFDDDHGFVSLSTLLEKLDNQFKTKKNRLFYFATPPKYFAPLLEKLNSHKLLHKKKTPWTRIIIEKPFGHDLSSSRKLQEKVDHLAGEDQIYRIDHYLGKETVQNLFVLRFGNTIFESLWSNQYIEQIQMTVAESLGIGSRGKFFNETGIIRDILQNHMMQLLSLIIMENPKSLKDPKEIKKEKIKALKALIFPTGKKLDSSFIQGQYEKGSIYGDSVNGYLNEADIPEGSKTETFAALKLFVDNKRWKDVPFYLRVGKRMPKRSTEIAIIFKKKPNSLAPLLGQDPFHQDQNTLSIRIQPNEGLTFKINGKVPGQGMVMQPVTMDFCYSSFFGKNTPEAYERLILDCMIGDKTLFASKEEVDLSWEFISPLLKEAIDQPLSSYAAGSWGPSKANTILEKDHKWRLL